MSIATDTADAMREAVAEVAESATAEAQNFIDDSVQAARSTIISNLGLDDYQVKINEQVGGTSNSKWGGIGGISANLTVEKPTSDNLARQYADVDDKYGRMVLNFINHQTVTIENELFTVADFFASSKTARYVPELLNTAFIGGPAVDSIWNAKLEALQTVGAQASQLMASAYTQHSKRASRGLSRTPGSSIGVVVENTMAMANAGHGAAKAFKDTFNIEAEIQKSLRQSVVSHHGWLVEWLKQVINGYRQLVQAAETVDVKLPYATEATLQRVIAEASQAVLEIERVTGYFEKTIENEAVLAEYKTELDYLVRNIRTRIQAALGAARALGDLAGSAKNSQLTVSSALHRVNS